MTSEAWPRQELDQLLANLSERRFLAEVWLWLHGAPIYRNPNYLGKLARAEFFISAKMTAASKGDGKSQRELTELYHQYVILTMTG